MKLGIARVAGSIQVQYYFSRVRGWLRATVGCGFDAESTEVRRAAAAVFSPARR